MHRRQGRKAIGYAPRHRGAVNGDAPQRARKKDGLLFRMPLHRFRGCRLNSVGPQQRRKGELFVGLSLHPDAGAATANRGVLNKQEGDCVEPEQK